MTTEPPEAQMCTSYKLSVTPSEMISRLLARIATLEQEVADLAVDMQNHRSGIARVKNDVNRLVAVTCDLEHRLGDMGEYAACLGDVGDN
ncbi:MAG: hypothetical protein M1840_008914 [Geoglossum simile]|nr:MAG: hypothetical protein M1840_008914 [Geoglossum simile]